MLFNREPLYYFGGANVEPLQKYTSWLKAQQWEKKENEKKEKKEADNKSKCSKVRPMAILEENYEFKHCTL